MKRLMAVILVHTAISSQLAAGHILDGSQYDVKKNYNLAQKILKDTDNFKKRDHKKNLSLVNEINRMGWNIESGPSTAIRFTTRKLESGEVVQSGASIRIR